MLTLDSLPVVVLRQIPQFVLESSWRDLSALSQTSQAWYDLAVPELYKNLRIKFRDLTSLQRDISELRADGNHGWRQKRLSVSGKKKDRANDFVIFKPPAAQNTFLEDSLSEFRDCYFSFLTWTSAYYRENDWEPIIALISRLKHLRVLNYAAMNMFPTCLHQAFGRFHPTCQLNIRINQSPSLDLPGLGRAHRFVSEGCHRDQPFDISILSTPTLHAFQAVYTLDRDSEDRPRWVHIDEPFRLLFMAPNLKHLIVDPRYGDDENPILKVKEEWQRFITKSRPSPVAVSLDTLTFIGEAYEPFEHILLNISTLVDLSTLRSLDIGVHSEPKMLTQAASMLVGLERLYIHMVPSARDYWDAPWDIEEMISAVQAFRPLRFLCLRGLLSFSSLDRILSHHSTLEGLSLEASYRQHVTPPPGKDHRYPISNGNHIRSVAKLCPRLEELRLPLQRTKGNAHECDLYRALGQLSRLHTVILDLDCDLRPTLTEELTSPRDRNEILPSPEYIRETLINATIDDTLVRDIFNLILSQQATRRLQRLRVDLMGPDFFKRELEHVLRQVSGTFLATRSGQHAVDVDEIGRVAWELWREDDIGQEGSIHIPKEIKDILEELWPLNSDRNRSKKWREMPLLVKSFPLADGVERDRN
ncbi:hypothetical protein BO78DRAFT_418145 [Aspergillus sclerotiicarbonarius CBS 121057]|uniref:F-box domain-containing protein n=1 Tax=Aspergillus sclerotiicarbonarius (strain CBS 121057 / IBT 28362) TaxID=1448318 RepID=A0A319EA72_ASPSB|nr:hypothetical protein BO78DRAFT_418145 [Aspergillus sclerotiicarbonarius CBS 121057]